MTCAPAADRAQACVQEVLAKAPAKISYADFVELQDDGVSTRLRVWDGRPLAEHILYAQMFKVLHFF
jgi:hypothetical protein